MLSAKQRAEFDERGITRLAGAVERSAVDDVLDRIWKHLGEDPKTLPGWEIVPPSSVKAVKRSGAFGVVHSPAVRDGVDGLLGEGRWTASPAGAGLLMTLPQKAAWTIPHKMWHFDYRAPGGIDRLPGAQLFLFLDVVEPRGGGTLVAAGAHRLVSRIQQNLEAGDPGRSAELRQALRKTVPWLRALWSLREGEDREGRFLKTATPFDGVDLQVVELTGEPGDVMLMHPWMPHTFAPNCRDRARMMLTDRTHAF